MISCFLSNSPYSFLIELNFTEFGVTEDKKNKSVDHAKKEFERIIKHEIRKRTGRDVIANDHAKTEKTTSWNETPPPPKKTKPK